MLVGTALDGTDLGGAVRWRWLGCGAKLVDVRRDGMYIYVCIYMYVCMSSGLEILLLL